MTPNNDEREIVSAIQSSVQRYVIGCTVEIQDEVVVVSGETPTYYYKQLAEHAIREIAREHLSKSLVSKIHVVSDLD